MMRWLRDNWAWFLLNLVALAALATLLRQLTTMTTTADPNFPLVNSGKWAVRFLLFSLAMTPANTLLGWRGAIKLRKPAGLWAFGFGVVHFVTYLIAVGPDWLRHPLPDVYAALGVVALLILSALASTSNRWAMKRLGKGWKRLHRLVYAAGCFALIHGLLESTSKRARSVDDLAVYEAQLYLVILVVLLLVRVPPLRGAISQFRHRLQAAR